MRTVPVSSPAKYGPQSLLFPIEGRVLVTGGAGYLGSTLVRRLLAKNRRVRVLDSFQYGSESLAAFRDHPALEVVHGDIREASVLEKSVSGCSTVVHLAAIVGDLACERHFELARSVNIEATKLLLNVCQREGVRRLILASTCSVYGVSPDTVDESSGASPVSHYAETKLAAEQFVLHAASRHFHPTVLRLSTLFGMSPRPRFDLVVNLLAARAVCEGRIRLLNGGQWRPFAHVADVARAFEMCMEADLSVVSGQVFNVGDGRLNLQLFALSRIVQTLIPAVQVLREEDQDLRSYRPSFQKIRTFLGFCSEMSIEDGVDEVCEALRTGEIRDFTEARYWNDRALEQCPATALERRSRTERINAQAGRRIAVSRAAACGVP